MDRPPTTISDRQSAPACHHIAHDSSCSAPDLTWIRCCLLIFFLRCSRRIRIYPKSSSTGRCSRLHRLLLCFRARPSEGGSLQCIISRCTLDSETTISTLFSTRDRQGVRGLSSTCSTISAWNRPLRHSAPMMDCFTVLFLVDSPGLDTMLRHFSLTTLSTSHRPRLAIRDIRDSLKEHRSYQRECPKNP